MTFTEWVQWVRSNPTGAGQWGKLNPPKVGVDFAYGPDQTVIGTARNAGHAGQFVHVDLAMPNPANDPRNAPVNAFGTFHTASTAQWPQSGFPAGNTVIHNQPTGPGAPVGHGFRVWPDVQCEPVVMPHCILYHGDRGSGRSTALQVRWRDAITMDPQREIEKEYRQAFPDKARLPLVYVTAYDVNRLRMELRDPFGPWEGAGDAEVRLYTLHVGRLEQLLPGMRGQARGLLVDGWLALTAKQRDLILHSFFNDGPPVHAIAL